MSADSVEIFHQINSHNNDRNKLQVLQRFYDEVAVTAFPDDELESFSEWELMLKEGFPAFEATVLEVGGEIVGGVTTEQYENASLLTYLVVKEQHRMKGYGGQLCRRVLAKVNESPLLLEAHDLTTVDETMNPRNRLAIYKSLGFKKITLPYVAPSVQLGSDNVSGLVLLILLEGERIMTEWSWLGKFLTEYWDVCYSKDDKPLSLMLNLIKRHNFMTEIVHIPTPSLRVTPPPGSGGAIIDVPLPPAGPAGGQGRRTHHRNKVRFDVPDGGGTGVRGTGMMKFSRPTRSAPLPPMKYVQPDSDTESEEEDSVMIKSSNNDNKEDFDMTEADREADDELFEIVSPKLADQNKVSSSSCEYPPSLRYSNHPKNCVSPPTTNDSDSCDLYLRPASQFNPSISPISDFSEEESSEFVMDDTVAEQLSILQGMWTTSGRHLVAVVGDLVTFIAPEDVYALTIEDGCIGLLDAYIAMVVSTPGKPEFIHWDDGDIWKRPLKKKSITVEIAIDNDANFVKEKCLSHKACQPIGDSLKYCGKRGYLNGIGIDGHHIYAQVTIDELDTLWPPCVLYPCVTVPDKKANEKERQRMRSALKPKAEGSLNPFILCFPHKKKKRHQKKNETRHSNNCTAFAVLLFCVIVLGFIVIVVVHFLKSNHIL